MIKFEKEKPATSAGQVNRKREKKKNNKQRKGKR